MMSCMVAALLVVYSPSSAFTHGMGVEAKLQGDRVIVEAFYDDDTPADDAKVVVTDDSGKEVIQGKTDKKGVWSFPAPDAGKYKVSVDAGGGHKAKTSFTIPARVSTPLASAEGADQSITVSEGPTRAMITGPQRWGMAAAGLVLIAFISFTLRRLMRRSSSQSGFDPVSN